MQLAKSAKRIERDYRELKNILSLGGLEVLFSNGLNRYLALVPAAYLFIIRLRRAGAKWMGHAEPLRVPEGTPESSSWPSLESAPPTDSLLNLIRLS